MDQEEKLSYIAGLMDGDGSFHLAKRKPDKESQSPLYYPVIQFGTARERMADFLESELGMWKYKRKPSVGSDGILRSSFWFCKIEKSAKCLPVLESLLPYLHIKKDRAQVLIDFIKSHPFVRGSHKLSQEKLDAREQVYLKMKSLNDERTFSRSLLKANQSASEDGKQWAYIAGLIDTDGSFSIKRENARRKDGSPVYTPQILISMTDLRGINAIRRACPFGTVRVIKAHTCLLKSCYRWGIYSKSESIRFVEKIIPFLIEKKDQAILLKEFCEKNEPTLYCRGGVSEEMAIFREESYKTMCALNKYGISKPSLIDLEARQGDRAEGESHGERLSEMASKEDATV